MIARPSSRIANGHSSALMLAATSILALALCLADTSSVAAQAARTTLVVGVADARNGAPLEGAEVTLPDISRISHTNWMGEARIAGIPSGVYRVRVRRVGFTASDLQLLIQGDSSGAVFMLEPATAHLAAVHVVARPTVDISNEFAVRRQLGIGRFLTAEDLAREQGQDFAVVATEHFPGLQAIAGRGGQLQLATRRSSCGTDTMFEVLPTGPGAASKVQPPSNGVTGEGSGSRLDAGQSATSQGSCFSDHPCHVKLFLDAVPLAETDIGVVKTEDLYGVEYYSTGNAPPQYHAEGAACGVMLLWSKAGEGG